MCIYKYKHWNGTLINTDFLTPESDIFGCLIKRLGKSLSVCLISCIHFMLKNLATYKKFLWLYDMPEW